MKTTFTGKQTIKFLRLHAIRERKEGAEAFAALLEDAATRLEAGEALAGSAAAAEVQLGRYCPSPCAFGWWELRKLRAALAAWKGE